jgi:hypothetical protein
LLLHRSKNNNAAAMRTNHIAPPKARKNIFLFRITDPDSAGHHMWRRPLIARVLGGQR